MVHAASEEIVALVGQTLRDADDILQPEQINTLKPMGLAEMAETAPKVVGGKSEEPGPKLHTGLRPEAPDQATSSVSAHQVRVIIIEPSTFQAYVRRFSQQETPMALLIR